MKIKSYLLYELKLFKRNRYLLMAFVLILIVGCILITLTPNNLFQYPALSFPNGMTKNMVIEQYQNRYQEKISQGIYDKETSLLFLYLTNNITQYEVILHTRILFIHDGIANVAYGLTFLNAASYFFLIFFSFLGANLFVYPFARGSLKHCIMVGGNRISVFFSKTLIILILSTLFSIIFCIVGFIIINKNCGLETLINYRDGCILIKVGEIVFSKSISLFLEALFYSFLTSLFGLFFKKELIVPVIIIVLFFLLYLFPNAIFANAARTLSGSYYWIVTLLPLFNLMSIADFGFLFETIFVFILYSVAIYLLSFFTYKRMRVVSI